MRLWVLSLASLSGLRIQHCRVSCGVDRRCGSDPMLLWLWHRPVATAPISPLAWEPPYASGAALEKTKRQKKRRKGKKRKSKLILLWKYISWHERCFQRFYENFCQVNMKFFCWRGGLIPGLAQWVKDPELPWAVVKFTDMARIPCVAVAVA